MCLGVSNGLHLAFLYVNPVSVIRFVMVWEQPLIDVSVCSVCRDFFVHFLFPGHVAQFSVLTTILFCLYFFCHTPVQDYLNE